MLIFFVSSFKSGQIITEYNNFNALLDIAITSSAMNGCMCVIDLAVLPILAKLHFVCANKT